MSGRLQRARRCLAVGSVVLGLSVGASAGPASRTDEESARRLAAAAWAEWSAMSASARSASSASGLGSAVWTLRRRTADRDTLISMAVAVEQGDESCLCGKATPSAADLERQGLLLAEAVLLWHLAGDAASVRHTTQRLRNVVYRAADAPYAPRLWTLHLRLLALTGGDRREEQRADPAGYGDLAIREAAGLAEPLRSRYLRAAAAWDALPAPARRVMLDGCEVPAADEPALPLPAPAAPAATVSPAGGLRDDVRRLVRRFQLGELSAVSDELSAPPTERAAWLAMQLGRAVVAEARAAGPDAMSSGSDAIGATELVERIFRLAHRLPPGELRVALVAGAGLNWHGAEDHAAIESLWHLPASVASSGLAEGPPSTR